MQLPNTTCKVVGYCEIHSSEDSEKIRQALLNVLPDSQIKMEGHTARASSDKLESLLPIYETIHSRKSQRAYLRHMKKNMTDDSTWFYLNKQAAYAGTVALCDDSEESPLGPVKIILHSSNIERVMEWLSGE